MSNSDVELMMIEVAWAVSGETISTVTVGADQSIRMLKEMLAEDAKTPAIFMDLMFGNQLASDSDCLRLFAPRDWAADMLPSSCLVLRKPPPRLLDVTRECFQTLPARSPQLPFQLSDTKLMQYIVAADGQGVNDRDVAWPRRRWWYYFDDDNDRYCYSNCTSLHYAAALNQVGLCKLILDNPHFHEANSVASIPVDFLGFRTGWTALHLASAEGSREVCALLLQHPKFTAIQKQDAYGLTALHVAVMFGYDDIVSTLLPAFDMSGLQLQDCDGVSAADMAVAVINNRSYCVFDHFSKSRYWKMLEAMAPRFDPISWQGLTESLIHESKGKILRLFQQRDCGKLMAGAHLGNGNIDLELLYHSDSWDTFAKEDRARKRYLDQKRKNSLKMPISQKPLVSKDRCGSVF